MQISELRRASGYLFIFAPPALLIIGLQVHIPALAFIFLIVLAPALRMLFGDAPGRQPEWSEGVATVLEALPIVAACAILSSVVFAQYILWRSHFVVGELVQFGLSLWAVFIFASCIAHELVHRRPATSRNVGRLLSGALGYPLLEHEHRAHHAKGGDVAGAEWPAVDESVWKFAARRWKQVFRNAWEGDRLTAHMHGHRLAGGLPLAVAATAATVGGFCLVGGATVGLLYVIVALTVAWTLQAITYVQHWALGSDCPFDAGGDGLAWEDQCQLQAWLTLSISYHQAHHRWPTVTYYRQEPMPGSPRLPAGYVILLFASLVPRLWRALMMPAVRHWQNTPHEHLSAGRKLLCYAKKPPK